MQTPAEIVPAYPDGETVGKTDGPNRGEGQYTECASWKASQDEKRSRGLRRDVPGNSSPDQRWQQKCGRYLWFQFTPATLAAWYNERTQVEEILPPEKNGMGLASWRGERTASVSLREEGWVDFGASARRADGKQDGGDALELTIRVTQETKPEVMQKLGRQLVKEAREAMENAAWRGDQPPAWVQSFMTDAGWQRYHALRAEAAHAANTWGGSWFSCSRRHTLK